MTVTVKVECTGEEEAKVFLQVLAPDGKFHEMDECLVIPPGRGIAFHLSPSQRLRVEAHVPPEGPEQEGNKKVP